MSNSFSKGFGSAMRTGSISLRVPHNLFVSLKLAFFVQKGVSSWFILSQCKGNCTWSPHRLCRLKCLDEPDRMAGPKPLLPEFWIHQSCSYFCLNREGDTAADDGGQAIPSHHYWWDPGCLLASCLSIHLSHGRHRLLWLILWMLHHLQHHRIWRRWYICKHPNHNSPIYD